MLLSTVSRRLLESPRIGDENEHSALRNLQSSSHRMRHKRATGPGGPIRTIADSCGSGETAVGRKNRILLSSGTFIDMMQAAKHWT
jgi:hypothetical protein